MTLSVLRANRPLGANRRGSAGSRLSAGSQPALPASLEPVRVFSANGLSAGHGVALRAMECCASLFRNERRDQRVVAARVRLGGFGSARLCANPNRLGQNATLTYGSLNGLPMAHCEYIVSFELRVRIAARTSVVDRAHLSADHDA
jgi:hypothetical protein